MIFLFKFTKIDQNALFVIVKLSEESQCANAVWEAYMNEKFYSNLMFNIFRYKIEVRTSLFTWKWEHSDIIKAIIWYNHCQNYFPYCS